MLYVYIIGLAHSTRCGGCVIPNAAKTLPLGQKRKSGRPARTVLALARQPNEILSILDEDEDDFEEPVPKISANEESANANEETANEMSTTVPAPTFDQDFDSLFTEPNLNETFFVNLMTRQSQNQTQNFDFLTPDNSRESFQSNPSQESSLLLIATRQTNGVIDAATTIIPQAAPVPVRKRKERSDKGKKRTK
jgi:hypothetical protein